MRTRKHEQEKKVKEIRKIEGDQECKIRKEEREKLILVEKKL